MSDQKEKAAEVASEMVQTSADRLDVAHRALTNALAFLERAPIQGMKSIPLLQEAFAFIYELRVQVEKDMGERATAAAKADPTNEVANEAKAADDSAQVAS